MRQIFRPRVLPSAFEIGLAGGLRVLLRPISPEDAPRFERGYVHLSEASRRQRFFGQSSALSKTQLKFLTEVDHIGHAAWGAMDRDRPEDPGIGVGRYIRTEEKSNVAEVALTVIDAYQDRGVGLALHACLHLTAAQHGIRRFVYDVSQDNERFLHHLKELGGKPLSVTEHIVRLEMKVYGSPSRVPGETGTGVRLAALMRALGPTAPDAA